MEWLNTLIDKWNQFRQKMTPYLQKAGEIAVKVGKSLSAVGSSLYKVRSLVMAAPVAAAAVVLAVINSGKLPAAVQFTKLTIDTNAENSLFGCLVIGMDYISREVAVFGPLAVTLCCLLLTLCSKRTMYPWLISLFTLVLPLLLLFTNVYAA